MIPLTLKTVTDAEEPFVARLRNTANGQTEHDAVLIADDGHTALYCGRAGLIEINGVPPHELDGDVVLVSPASNRLERLVRAASPHNTLLVTERCDQLCVMCSQPPKKTHVDRFGALTEAALLAPPNCVLGVTGGEPTLYKEQLFGMIEQVLAQRPDLKFHVLSNAQHFDPADVARLRNPLYRKVEWGIPIYAAGSTLHDEIVGKAGAFDRLEESLALLLAAGAAVELRTVVLSSNVDSLPTLARFVVSRLRFVEAWSIMQLENIGFARGRWLQLYVDHVGNFAPIAEALGVAVLHGMKVRLFNFARCTVPAEFRDYAVASISDWKRRYATACTECNERDLCSGFFEWHPNPDAVGVTPL